MTKLKRVSDGVYQTDKGIRVRRCLASAGIEEARTGPYPWLRPNSKKPIAYASPDILISFWRISFSGRLIDSCLTLNSARRKMAYHHEKLGLI